MKKVLVLGASGAMGCYLVPFLAEKGHAAMRDFSLARDERFLLPMARAAKARRPDLFVFASPGCQRPRPLQDAPAPRRPALGLHAPLPLTPGPSGETVRPI